MGYLDKLKAKADSNAAGELKMLPLSALEPSARNFYRMCEIDQLADSIAANGLEQNLVVKAESGGKYRIITGHRRYQALLRLMSRGVRVDTVPCIVRPAETDAQEMLRMIASNQYRELSDYEKMLQVEAAADAVKTLRSTKVKELGGIRLDGPTREVISRLTGMSGPAVSKYAGIAEKLVPKLKAKMKQGLLPFTVAYEACQYPAEWQKDMADGTGAVSLKDVQEVAAKKQTAGRRAAEKEPSPLPAGDITPAAEEARRGVEDAAPYSGDAGVQATAGEEVVESGRFGRLRDELSGKGAAPDDKAWDQLIVWNREKPPEDVYAVVHAALEGMAFEQLAYYSCCRDRWYMDQNRRRDLCAQVIGWFKIPKWED